MYEFPRPRAMALGDFAIHFQSLLRGQWRPPTETRRPLQPQTLHARPQFRIAQQIRHGALTISREE
jgi:hypothetical protein